MFKKLFKPAPPEFANTDIISAPKKAGNSNAGNPFPDEVALPEVAELNSESAWAAFNADPDSPVGEPAVTQQDTFLPTTCFSDTQPMEEMPTTDARKPTFSSGYMDILNEIELDQDQRRRITRDS